MLEVKLVNPAHQFQICFADPTRLVIGTRPADPYQPGLLCHRQSVITIDYRLAPSSPDRFRPVSDQFRLVMLNLITKIITYLTVSPFV
jgi:hypothetical protein